MQAPDRCLRLQRGGSVEEDLDQVIYQFSSEMKNVFGGCRNKNTVQLKNSLGDAISVHLAQYRSISMTQIFDKSGGFVKSSFTATYPQFKNILFRFSNSSSKRSCSQINFQILELFFLDAGPNQNISPSFSQCYQTITDLVKKWSNVAFF